METEGIQEYFFFRWQHIYGGSQALTNIWQPHFWKFVKAWVCSPLGVSSFTDDQLHMLCSPSKESLPHSLFWFINFWNIRLEEKKQLNKSNPSPNWSTSFFKKNYCDNMSFVIFNHLKYIIQLITFILLYSCHHYMVPNFFYHSK